MASAISFCGERADEQQVVPAVDAAGREREHGIAVRRRVRRAQIARANPSCAICATFGACAFVSRALVATTPMVVFSPAVARSVARAVAQQPPDIGSVVPSSRAHAGDDGVRSPDR